MSWGGKYVGIPYEHLGASLLGCDCWGLVRMVYTLEAGIDVPTYEDISERDLAGIGRGVQDVCALPPWRPVNGEPRPFDVVLMWSMPRVGTRRSLSHCGVMSDMGRLLHVEIHTHTVEVPAEHPSVRGRIHSRHRHEALA